MNLDSTAILKGYFNTGDIPTETNFASLIEGLKGIAGDRIYSTEGKAYSLVGLSDTQKGDTLQTAINEITNNAGHSLFVPGGTYRKDTGFLWQKRNTNLIGFGRNKATELVSYGSDAFTIDGGIIVYNSNIMGISLATLNEDANEYHALRVRNVTGGAPVTVSQIELNVHLHAASGDLFHFDTGLNADNAIFDLKMTSSLVDVGGYAIWYDAGGSGSKIIMHAPNGDVYFGTGAANTCILLTGVVKVGDFDKINLTNDGTNCYLFSPSLIDPIDRTTGQLKRIYVDNGVLAVEDAN